MSTRAALVIGVISTAFWAAAAPMAVAQSMPVVAEPAAVDPTAPRLRGRPARMPADGALLIECGQSLPLVVTVVDAGGLMIEGVVRRVGDLQPAGFEATYTFAWLPSSRPAVGVYEATMLDPRGQDFSNVQRFEVIEPFERGLPPIASEPSATWSSWASTVESCTTRESRPIPSTQFPTEYFDTVELDAGLSSTASAAQLDQFLFRLRHVEGASEDGGFVPFEEVETTSFVKPANEYCVRVEALNIVTLEAQTYDFVTCAPGIDQHLGIRDVEPTPLALAMDTCVVPPLRFKDQWCTVNAGACDTSAEACEHYTFVCGDVEQDAGLLERASKARASSGCSVGAPAKKLRWLMPLSTAFALFAVLRRRRTGGFLHRGPLPPRRASV